MLAKQDATGKWGGSLISSTSAAGTDSTFPSSQLAVQLILDSSVWASFTGSLTLTGTGSTLRALGSTVLGTTEAQTLTVNAASNSPVLLLLQALPSQLMAMFSWVQTAARH